MADNDVVLVSNAIVAEKKNSKICLIEENAVLYKTSFEGLNKII